MGKLRCKTLIAACIPSLFFVFSIDAIAASSSAITIELGQRFGEFIVNNHGDALLLQSTVVVEQQNLKGKWQKIPVSNLELRNSCIPSPSPSCIELGANVTLRPVAWTGNFCSSQCPVPCRLDGAAPPGTYRFVIASCHSERKYTSTPLEKAK